MTVGDRIRLRRIELGMTQEELAKKCGYATRATVCAVESRGDAISTKTVAKFAKVLGVSESYLLGWEENYSKINTDLVAEVIDDVEMRDLITEISTLSKESKDDLFKYVKFLKQQEKG